MNATDQAILVVGLFISICAVAFTVWAIFLASCKPGRRHRKEAARRG